jgi:hypothetical protein
MSSPGVLARSIYIVFGVLMTAVSFVYIVLASFWKLPELFVVICFYSVNLLRIIIADRIRNHLQAL